MKFKSIYTAILMASGLLWNMSANAADIVIDAFDPGQKSSRGVKIEIPSQAVIQQNSDSLFHQTDDPAVGNAKSHSKIVEFFDYRCAHCNRMSSVVAELIKKNHNVRVIFKEFPVLGSVSDYASRAALAANNQGKYYQFHEALMQVGRDLTKEKVMEIAQSLGLDIKKLTADMDSDAVSQKIKANHKLGQQLKILGTPVFIIENNSKPFEVIVGETDLANFQQLTK